MAVPFTFNPIRAASGGGGDFNLPTNMPKTYGELIRRVNERAAADAQRMRTINAFGGAGGGGAFGLFTGSPYSPTAPTGGAASVSPSNPFTTISNVKNPSIQSALDSVLSGIRGLSSDPNVNLNVVKANTKSQALASRLAGAQNRFDLDVNDSRQSFSDFVNSFREMLPQARANLESDTGAIGEFYDKGPGGVKAQLDKIARDRAMATNQAAQRAMQLAQARNNFNRLQSGNSTYLDKQLGDSMAGIGIEAAREKAGFDRDNLLTVKDAQARLAGSRNSLQDAFLNRFLTPAFARQQLAGNELAQLGSLVNMDNANNFYQIDSPEQMLARRLGLLGGVSNLDLANNFYGLQRPYEQDTGGYLNIGGGRGRGGGGSGYLPDFSEFDLSYPGQPNIGPDGGGGEMPWWQRERARTGFGNVGRWPGMSDAERAAALYQQISGFNPRTDPNFSNELWGNVGGNPPYTMDQFYEDQGF